MTTHADFDTLKHEVQLLRSRLEKMENAQAGDASPASADELAAVSRLTQEVFSIEPTFKVEQHVECEGSYVVVEVPAIGTEAEIAARSDAWHLKMAARKPVLSSFALSLQFQQ